MNETLDYKPKGILNQIHSDTYLNDYFLEMKLDSIIPQIFTITDVFILSNDKKKVILKTSTNHNYYNSIWGRFPYSQDLYINTCFSTADKTIICVDYATLDNKSSGYIMFAELESDCCLMKGDKIIQINRWDDLKVDNDELLHIISSESALKNYIFSKLQPSEIEKISEFIENKGLSKYIIK